jgi:hypothetical protein
MLLLAPCNLLHHGAKASVAIRELRGMGNDPGSEHPSLFSPNTIRSVYTLALYLL